MRCVPATTRARPRYTTHDVTAALTSAGSPVGAPVTHALGVRLGSCKYGWMNTYCNGTAVECIGFKLQFVDSATGARVPDGPSTVFLALAWRSWPFLANVPAQSNPPPLHASAQRAACISFKVFPGFLGARVTQRNVETVFWVALSIIISVSAWSDPARRRIVVHCSRGIAGRCLYAQVALTL